MTDLPLRALLEAMPSGTTLTPAGVLELLDQHDTNGLPRPSQEPQEGPPAPWPERLWSAHPDTRMGTPEVCAALRRPRSFVYRAVARDLDPLPAMRFGGELRFMAEDVRRWVERNEVHP